MQPEEMEKALQNAAAEVESLKIQVQQLQRIVSEGTHLPRTALLSDNFLTRAFAVLGHYMVAALIIAAPFYLLFFIFFLIFGLSMFK